MTAKNDNPLASRALVAAQKIVQGTVVFVALLGVATVVFLTVWTVRIHLPLETYIGWFALILASGAYVVAANSMQLVVLQMKQAEEDRSTDFALAEAMRDLAHELRRRPEVSSSVTLALFAAPETRKPGNSVNRNYRRAPCENDPGGTS